MMLIFTEYVCVCIGRLYYSIIFRTEAREKG